MPTLPEELRVSPYVERLIRGSLERIKSRIGSQMDYHSRHASRKSINSLRIESNPASGVLWGDRSFMAMETGRRGGKVPQGFRHIIEQWIIDKGITIDYAKGGNESTQRRRVAYLIAKKIRESGTQLFRYKQTQDIYSSAIQTELNTLSEKIAYKIDSSLDRIIERFIKSKKHAQ